MEEKNNKNENILKTGVEELNENMTKLFSTDKKDNSPDRIDASLSEFEDNALQNFKLQKDENLESSN